MFKATGKEKTIEKDELELLTKVAEEGDADAQYCLGELYYKGEGLAKDLKKAVYWYTKAAETGWGHAGAIKRLVDCYSNGEGVEKDLEKAKFWQDKAESYENHGFIEV